MVVEGLIVNGASEILKKLCSVVAQVIYLAWVVKDDLKKLKKNLETILAVTADAEKRQVNEASVRLWLTRLKDVAYDAEDVLDEFVYDAIRKRDPLRSLGCKVRDFVSSSNPLVYSFKMAHKIKNINGKLDEIAKDMRDFGFLKTITSTTFDQSREQLNRKTVSFVDDSIIEGREKDKSAIVSLLLATNNTSSSSTTTENHSQSEKVSVISIVGMGGLGKTTLAQLVYNDKSVVKHFELRMWICVSDDDFHFDVFKIIRNIIEQSSTIHPGSNEEVLSHQVQETLIGKKYLLVLDDLWNEKPHEWEKLKSWLDIGAQGSKILITTRKNQVATIVKGIISPYNLQKLSEDQCLSIIKKKAFSPGGATLDSPNMITVAMEIAKKCCGIPLVAKSLGGLMHSKSKESIWLSIRDQNDIWDKLENHNNIIPVLKLSYDNLPSHLKQCFSYCSIFPKDWDINKETLIRLWMAEGFLQPFDGGNERSMEDIGNEYFESLLWSSFFQDTKKNDIGDIETCKMHDLVHDLAQKIVGKNECSTIKVRSEMENVSEARRLLMFDVDDEVSRTFPNALHNAKKLRTIVNLRRSRNAIELNSFFSNKHLRVLHLHGSYATKFPSPIPELRLLRYLDLSTYSHNIGEVIHDHSIGSLYNLQTLVLRWCPNVRKLPRNIGSLINLRHLDFSNTNIEVLPDSITSLCNLRKLEFYGCRKLKALPKDFGHLKNLRSLNLEGTSIAILPESCTNNLTNLEIVHLGDCKLPTEIKNWTKLRHFKHWSSESDEMPKGIERLTLLQILNSYVVRKEEVVTGQPKRIGGIEELHGLNLLEELTIRCLENVRGVIDEDRANLKGKLNLRELKLEWDETEGDECRSDRDVRVLEALQPHQNLKGLYIEGFMGSKLPTWMGGVSSCLFNLVRMELSICTRCEQLPALGLLPRLRYLVMLAMESVKRLGDEFYCGGERSEDVANNNELTAPSISSIFFPSLVEFNLQYMGNLEEWVAPPPPPPPPPPTVLPLMFPAAGSFPLLEKIFTYKCPKLTITPTSFPSLKELNMWNSNGEALNSITRGLTSLTSLHIENLPELIYFPRGLLRNNTCLQNLRIEECENFQGFHNLDEDRDINEVIVISSGTELKSCSLQSLVLIACPVLMFLPDLQGWTTLRKLEIRNCKELKKSLPSDRNCLSFIEDLRVDFWKT